MQCNDFPVISEKNEDIDEKNIPALRASAMISAPKHQQIEMMIPARNQNVMFEVFTKGAFPELENVLTSMYPNKA